MNSYKLNCMVEYIRMQDDFPFDVLDVEEGIEQVLGYFGFFQELSEVDREEVTQALLDRAAECQWVEIERLIARQEAGRLEMIKRVAEVQDILASRFSCQMAAREEDELEVVSAQ